MTQEEIKRIAAAVADRLYYNKNFLTTKEACSFLGLSTRALYQLRVDGQIASYCPNGKITYYKRSDLERWIMTGHRMSNSEMNAKVVEYFDARRAGRRPKMQ